VSAHILLLALLHALSQTPDDSGVISGKAVNGTIGGTPLSGAQIVLRASQDGAFVPVAETITDAEGRFKFENLSIERGLIYLAGVNRAGVHYPGPRLRLQAGRPAAQVRLIAFDAIESPSPLICRRHEIVVQPGQGFLEITESILIENPSQTAFVGQQDGELSPVTLRLSLPAGFDKVTFDREFHGRNFQITSGQLTTDLPWPPGSRDLKFTYRWPAEQGHAVLTRVLDQPTDRVLVRVTGKDMGRIRCNFPTAITANDGETSFGNSSPLPAGHQIELRLGAVPIRIEAYGRWVAVGLLAMLIIGSVGAVRSGRLRTVAGNNKRDRGERTIPAPMRGSQRPKRATPSSRRSR
jgi:hypothetical protein